MTFEQALGLFGAVLGIVGVIYGIYSGIKSAGRAKAKDSEEDGKSTGTILTELGYIKAGVDDVKQEQRDQRKTNAELTNRMVAVEVDIKQIHRQLDTHVHGGGE